ncbi:MAG: hypothetical protein CMF70_04465 [Magnetovibrio sp.]|nr:hypothetical protein [Magnetovibrio sp.]
MTIELEMLTWTAVLTLLIWIPYILARIMNIGLIETLTYKNDNAPVPAWAERAKKAHYNAIENLIPFTVLILVAHSMEVSNEATQSAAIAYFWLRVAHYVVYTASIPFGRTLMFAGAWLAQICIASQIIIS